MAIGLRPSYLCLCTSFLLVVALAGTRPAAAQCETAVAAVPDWCTKQFFNAASSGAKGDEFITHECCLLLGCVHESNCDSILRGFCPAPDADECPVPPVAPAVSTGAAS